MLDNSDVRKFQRESLVSTPEAAPYVKCSGVLVKYTEEQELCDNSSDVGFAPVATVSILSPEKYAEQKIWIAFTVIGDNAATVPSAKAKGKRFTFDLREDVLTHMCLDVDNAEIRNLQEAPVVPASKPPATLELD